MKNEELILEMLKRIDSKLSTLIAIEKSKRLKANEPKSNFIVLTLEDIGEGE